MICSLSRLCIFSDHGENTMTLVMLKVRQKGLRKSEHLVHAQSQQFSKFDKLPTEIQANCGECPFSSLPNLCLYCSGIFFSFLYSLRFNNFWITIVLILSYNSFKQRTKYFPNGQRNLFHNFRHL